MSLLNEFAFLIIGVELNQHKLAGDRSKERKGGDGAITIDVLLEALEESMRIIWQFIQADKDVSTTTLTCPRDIQVELQDPADSVHLMELRTDLQKVSFYTCSTAILPFSSCAFWLSHRLSFFF